jgi:S-adenosylmethionine:tRNA-ribosyltransferase-isomerase (queuine synthetase)
MKTTDCTYNLPDNLIAKHPVTRRGESRLPAYKHTITNYYRFLSYGDSMLIL